MFMVLMRDFVMSYPRCFSLTEVDLLAARHCWRLVKTHKLVYRIELGPNQEVFPRTITQDLEVLDTIFIPGEENKEGLLTF